MECRAGWAYGRIAFPVTARNKKLLKLLAVVSMVEIVARNVISHSNCSVNGAELRLLEQLFAAYEFASSPLRRSKPSAGKAF